MPMKPTALGDYLVIVPPPPEEGWRVIYISKSGKYCGEHFGLANIEEARKSIRETRRWHKKVAARKESRRRKKQ